MPRIQETPFPGIAASMIELEEGESWDDIVTVQYRRDEAQMLAVSVQQQIEAARDAMKQLRHTSHESNPDLLERVAATVTLIKFNESFRLLCQAQGALGAVAAPLDVREQIEIALNEARAKSEALKADEQKDMRDIASLVTEMEAVHNAHARHAGMETASGADSDAGPSSDSGRSNLAGGATGGGAN